MKKIDQLTFTRFLAALAVVFFHSGTVFPLNTFPINPLINSGQIAVSYFFVLSGFVLAYVYYRPGQRFGFPKYFEARFSRIYPVYFLSFVLTCLYYIDIMSRLKSGKMLASIFLVQAWIPTYALSFNIASWSLSVEVFFYLLFPFLVWWSARLPVRSLIWISTGFWIVSQAVHVVLYQGYFPAQHNLLLYFPPFHLNSFLLGMVGGIWYLTRDPRSSVDQRVNRLFLITALVLVGLLLIGRRVFPAVSQSFSLDAGMLSPFFLVVVLTLALDTTTLAGRLSHPALVLLGDASYALFILHVPVRWIGERLNTSLNLPNSILIYIYWVLIVAASVLVHVRMERPARDWLRRNFAAMLFVATDILVILSSVYAGYALQLGIGKELSAYAGAIRFMARVAVPAYGLALLLPGLYYWPPRVMPVPILMRRVLLAALLGGAIVTAAMLLAAEAGWIEGFSRLSILISGVMIAALVFLSRAAAGRFFAGK